MVGKYPSLFIGTTDTELLPFLTCHTFPLWCKLFSFLPHAKYTQPFPRSLKVLSHFNINLVFNIASPQLGPDVERIPM